MKETRFLVHLKENGYVKKVTKEGDWEFTKNLNESLKFKTITGAYVRLIEAKKIPDLSKSDSRILIIETSDEKLKVVSKLEYKLSRGRGRPPKEEPSNVMEAEAEQEETTTSSDEKKERVIPSVPKEDRTQLNEGVEPKKRRGRPPKVKTEDKETINERTDEKPKKRRGRPRKETPTNTVKTNDVSGTTVSEPLVKKKEEEELKTDIVESDLGVTIVKTSTTDSFWD